jgi:broad specificity phosphatase PhoE
MADSLTVGLCVGLLVPAALVCIACVLWRHRARRLALLELPDQKSKRVILIRHGESEYNVWRKQSLRNGTALCVCDPLIFDPRLSPRGVQQAVQLRAELEQRGLPEQIELLVCSPLTRALQTCALGFGLDCRSFTEQAAAQPNANPHRRALVCALPRERLDKAGDVGLPTEELRKRLPAGVFTFDEGSMGTERWWEGGGGGGDAETRSVQREKMAHMHTRVAAFRAWLLARPEGCIAVVGHSAFFKSFMGSWSKPRNCEICEVVVTTSAVHRAAAGAHGACAEETLQLRSGGPSWESLRGTDHTRSRASTLATSKV